MATRRSKNAENEKLDDAHMEHVIKMLEQPAEGTKPWTKKECCEYLNIAYNTTRLGTLITKYKDKKAREAAMRAEKRGKPATEGEMSYVVSSYLEGMAIDSISSALYRSSSFVRTILDRLGVPIRQPAHSYFTPALLPEESVRDTFKPGELVYSSRYDSLAKIRSELKPNTKGNPNDFHVYLVYLLSDKQQQLAYQAAYDLASLEHLRKYMNNV